MDVVVVGAGYVGLVTSACLARYGHKVICVETDLARLRALSAGEVPFQEKGLRRLVRQTVATGQLRFSESLENVVASADIVIVAVGTPARDEDGSADLRHVDDVTRTIARCGSPGTTIVIKSTVPVGTADRVAQYFLGQCTHAGFVVVSNPEFLRQGTAISDFCNPNRIVVGIPDPGAKEPISELYAPIISSGTPVAFMTRRSAELVKYASNAFLAMKVTYANELADLCEKVGANIQDVVLGMGYDERIGNQYLRVGPGFGGSCFPKDISALLHLGGQHGARLELLAATDRANRRRIESMSERIVAALDGYPEKRTVCALGLTFKAGTGDLRDSPAVSILRSLTQTGANVVVYDPVTRCQERCDLGGLKLADDAYDAARDSDLLIILTEWPQFRELHLPTLKKLMRRPSILDLRNVLGRAAAREHGFSYSSLGDGELR